MKRNILNTTKILLTAAAGFFAVACTGNFEDMNTKPYRPTFVDPPQLLSPMMRNIISTHENDAQMIDEMIGMEYGGYVSANTDWGGAGAFATYNPRQGWWGSMYGTLFQKTYGNWAIIRNSTKGIGPIYSLAQILRVATMLKVTDTYGPIPYSKVNGLDVAVTYDAQDVVYTTMLADLAEAVSQIQTYTASGGDKELLAGYDVSSFNGDLDKWIRYANSLRLRMAIRMSATNLSAEAQQIAEEVVKLNLISSNSDNLFVSPESKNPYSVAGGEWGELRINASITSYMNGYEDARRPDYFTAIDKQYVGLRSGIAGLKGSGNEYDKTTSQFFLKSGTATPVLVMCAAEVSFLKAEGALLGWDMGGTVENFYNEGIKLSFEQHGAVGAEEYLADETKKPGNYQAPDGKNNANAVSTITIKWDDAASDAVKIERLMVQKWIAMFPCGFEAWCDIRRTGYPKLFATVDNKSTDGVSSTRGMRRVPFSRDEFNTNEANVTAAITLLGGPDTGATDLWWAKKN